MHRCFFVALALSLPLVAVAELPVPMVDVRFPGQAPPLLFIWAHAGGTAAIRFEAPNRQALACDVYQVDDEVTLSLARGVALEPLKPGSNLIEIPLPEKSERGKLLINIASSPDGAPFASLMVDILPKDAWDSFSKHAKDGKVFIDPSIKAFHAWANSHGIPSTVATPDKPAEFYFGKPANNLNMPPLGRFVIFERDKPDAFPVIEVLSIPEVTKILLPAGFFDEFSNSATAQALLLEHLNLLP